jgi:hypothetical protein
VHQLVTDTLIALSYRLIAFVVITVNINICLFVPKKQTNNRSSQQILEGTGKDKFYHIPGHEGPEWQ